MEPIGQKVISPNTEDVLVASDLPDEAIEKDETKIFDVTLDGALAEFNVGDIMSEKIVGQDELDEFSESNLLSKNQIHTLTSDTNMGVSDISNSNMALEVMEEILLSEDLSSEKNQHLQNSEKVLPEMVHESEPRHRIGEKDLDSHMSGGVTEDEILPKGMKSKLEVPSAQLQTFFHYTNPIVEESDFSENEQKILLSKNSNKNLLGGLSNPEKISAKSVQSEQSDLGIIPSEMSLSELDEIEKPLDFFIDNQGIVKSKNSNNLEKPEVELEISRNHSDKYLEHNTNLRIPSQVITDLTQESEFVSKNHAENATENSQHLTNKESKLDGVDYGKFSEENLVNSKKNELPQYFKKIKDFDGSEVVGNLKKTEVKTPLTENIKISDDQQSIAKGVLNEVKTPLTENIKISEEQKIAVFEKSIKGNNVTEKFDSIDDLNSVEKSKVSEGFQMSVKDNTKDNTKYNYEKSLIEPLNHSRIASVQETEFFRNTKTTNESVNISGINSTSDVSITSNIKVGETSVAEALRNTELPFDIEQVVGRVRIMRGNGVEEMTLRLHPEELGQMTIKIRQTGTDLLIDMRVENAQAKLLVESGFDSLRNRFLENEFSFQDLALNVDINERDSQFSRDRKNSDFEDNFIAAEESEKQENEQSEEIPPIVSRSDSGLNLYV